ncbi:urease accessory protein [Bradyrhizobium sp. AZCC 2262]|uniref:urease accessory protein UreF n=1 Tax=Bradyrhizobium sp. AZCC 2262 TaxID=3117022 RepID=UPI002FF287DB
MFDVPAALALLHYGDSAYPAGGFAFSWGVEGLMLDGRLDGAVDLDDFVADQLGMRWNGMDRVLFLRAYAASDLGAVRIVDLLAEAMTPLAEMREGSRRAGRALLGVAARHGGALSSAYRSQSSTDTRLGHLPVAQALSYRDAGLDTAAGEMLSAWTLVTGLVSAAVRLGVIGHVEAQHSVVRARGVVAGLLSRRADPDAEPWSFTPLIDIAISRGPCRDVRMFST